MTRDLRIGHALQEAWNIFLRAPEVFSVLALGYIILIYGLSIVPGLGQLLTLLLTPLAYGSIYLLAEHDRKHGKADFSAMKEVIPFTPQLVMVKILTTIFISIGLLLLLIPGLFLAVCYLFANLFVMLEGKTFWEAMESSRKLVQANWFSFFGLWLFHLILFCSGLLLVGIGVLVTGPLAVLMLYTAFRDLRHEAV